MDSIILEICSGEKGKRVRLFPNKSDLLTLNYVKLIYWKKAIVISTLKSYIYAAIRLNWNGYLKASVTLYNTILTINYYVTLSPVLCWFPRPVELLLPSSPPVLLRLNESISLKGPHPSGSQLLSWMKKKDVKYKKNPIYQDTQRIQSAGQLFCLVNGKCWICQIVAYLWPRTLFGANKIQYLMQTCVVARSTEWVDSESRRLQRRNICYKPVLVDLHLQLCSFRSHTALFLTHPLKCCHHLAHKNTPSATIQAHRLVSDMLILVLISSVVMKRSQLW